MDEYESLSHSKWECKYHVVFIPKCRRKTLYGELRRHLGDVFRKLAQQKESRIEEGHLMPDHVHMMISIPLCNVLVCLAVWMSFGARSITDKVMVIVPPVAAFVAAGFEHSIANLYLLPYGLAVKSWAGPEFWAAIGQGAAAYPDLTVSGALHNIVVATIGNLVGGSLMVGAVYWFVYLRRRS